MRTSDIDRWAATLGSYNPHSGPFGRLNNLNNYIPCGCRYCRTVRRSAPTRNDSPKEGKQ